MSSKTTERTRSEGIVQFSVFLSNRVGRLLDVVRLVSGPKLHVVALSVLDTADSSIVRLIMDDPDTARAIFQEHALPFNETQLIAVEMPGSASDMEKVLCCLLRAEANIHYAYPFLIRPNNHAVLAVHVEDPEVASTVLRQYQFRLLTQQDIAR